MFQCKRGLTLLVKFQTADFAGKRLIVFVGQLYDKFEFLICRFIFHSFRDAQVTGNASIGNKDACSLI